MIELASISRGLPVVDAVAKKAPVAIADARPLSSGKFMVLFSGDVASVEESLEAGIEVAGDQLIGRLFIPNLHPHVPEALATRRVAQGESLGILETASIAATVLAADAAAKAANVGLIEIRLAQGIGGKGFFTLAGELSDIEAGVAAGVARSQEEGCPASWEIIARPHPDAREPFTQERK
jgi:microcompartment protein CcmL/EutN